MSSPAVLSFIIKLIILIVAGGLVIFGYSVSQKGKLGLGLFIIVLAFTCGVYAMNLFSAEFVSKYIYAEPQIACTSCGAECDTQYCGQCGAPVTPST